MRKIKFMLFNEKQVIIVQDALRVYLAIRTEEYHKEPDLKRAQLMDDINETLDLFTKPKRPKSKVQLQVERSQKL
jgi:hypothetical protein